MRYFGLGEGAKHALPSICVTACNLFSGNRLAAFPSAFVIVHVLRGLLISSGSKNDGLLGHLKRDLLSFGSRQVSSKLDPIHWHPLQLMGKEKEDTKKRARAEQSEAARPTSRRHVTNVPGIRDGEWAELDDDLTSKGARARLAFAQRQSSLVSGQERGLPLPVYRQGVARPRLVSGGKHGGGGKGLPPLCNLELTCPPAESEPSPANPNPNPNTTSSSSSSSFLPSVILPLRVSSPSRDPYPG
ncbi:hypothetical protein NL676_035368 [Syzygium grande]|nr:hypothetical protein NL676_035368 [Syzygium grande]